MSQKEKNRNFDHSEVDKDLNLSSSNKLLNITNFPTESELLQDQIELIYKSVVNLRRDIKAILIPAIRQVMREELIRFKGGL
ncbi:MAG TPA: hypothetical protein VE445_08685 [Nitrososphaeraceae archaeon]|jgi:hypothetical protein|nr:hypothetical protein [Nitrososphaeraceae archaeon]